MRINGKPYSIVEGHMVGGGAQITNGMLQEQMVMEKMLKGQNVEGLLVVKEQMV